MPPLHLLRRGEGGIPTLHLFMSGEEGMPGKYPEY